MNVSTEPSSQEQIKRVVNSTSVVSAALGVVLSPIPFADEIMLLPVYGFMAARIGRLHGLGVRQVPWRPMAAAAVTGLCARAALNAPFAFMPGVAAVMNATSAAALTQLLGGYMERTCACPERATRLSLRELTDALKQRVRRAPSGSGPT
jgi:uncharacterized protein (DUF697 family)